MSHHGHDTAAWTAAIGVHAHLARGGQLRPVRLPAVVNDYLGWDDYEYPVAHFQGGLAFARYYPTTVRYRTPGPALVIGPPQVVTGYALGSLAGTWWQRRSARRWAAPQWRPTPLLGVVVTTRRLWCHLVDPDGSTRWVRFGYDVLADVTLVGHDMVLRFRGDEPPLRLAGPWAAWCTAVIAHYCYGAAAIDALPALSTGPMPPAVLLSGAR